MVSHVLGVGFQLFWDYSFDDFERILACLGNPAKSCDKYHHNIDLHLLSIEL
jgi:hypothetical protein